MYGARFVHDGEEGGGDPIREVYVFFFLLLLFCFIRDGFDEASSSEKVLTNKFPKGREKMKENNKKNSSARQRGAIDLFLKMSFKPVPHPKLHTWPFSTGL